MTSKPFHFKEFTIYQDKTAMKIGTDAVLLGAWCKVAKHVDTILDIGSGTGVIGLMMAQKSNAFTIDAVEIDANAYEQTVGNFEASDWADRLFCYHSDFTDFADQISEEEESYDLVISNPPFYSENFETDNDSRNKARFTSSLSFEDLLKGVSIILKDDGCFSTIIPKKEEASFIELAKKKGLYVNRICHVRGNETSAVKRSLLEFSFRESAIDVRELIIETERHKYTEAYISLTNEFYLKM